MANAQDLIISRLEEGVDPKWGLSDLGRQQADAAGEALLAQLELPGRFDPALFIVYCSPFSRCLETAHRAASHLDIHLHDSRIVEAPQLRERFFGVHDLTSSSNYPKVWADDVKSTAIRPPGGGESVEDVAERLGKFIDDIEAQHAGYVVLLVSHGDALSILAAQMLGTDMSQHREHGLDNCEIMRIPKK